MYRTYVGKFWRGRILANLANGRFAKIFPANIYIQESGACYYKPAEAEKKYQNVEQYEDVVQYRNTEIYENVTSPPIDNEFLRNF